MPNASCPSRFTLRQHNRANQPFQKHPVPRNWLSQDKTRAPRGAWSKQNPAVQGRGAGKQLIPINGAQVPLQPPRSSSSHPKAPQPAERVPVPLPIPTVPSQRAHGAAEEGKPLVGSCGTTRTWLSCPHHLHLGHLRPSSGQAARQRCLRAGKADGEKGGKKKDKIIMKIIIIIKLAPSGLSL